MQEDSLARRTPLFDLLAHSASHAGDSLCLTFEQRDYTYSAMLALSLAFASRLSEHFKGAVKPGLKVALYMPNSDLFVAAFFGLSALGATIVPVNPLLKSDEIAHILSDSKANLLVLSSDLLAQVNSAALQGLAGLVVMGAAEFATGLDVLRLDRDTLLATAVDLPEGVSQTDLDSPCLIVYTSGTTGKPKGAVLSHGNVAFTISAYPRVLNLGSRDRMLAVLPFCHLYGLLVVLVGAIKDQAALIVMPHFEPHHLLTAISRDKVTVLAAVPTMYHFMLMAMQDHAYDLSSLRLAVTGGAPMPDKLMVKVQEALPVPVLEGYALTETTVIATLNPVEQRKLGSVGLPFAGIEIGILDRSGGGWLSSGREQVGEICIKGPCIMQGYFNNDIATAEAIKDGWLHTGDLGFVDDDGYLFVSGRTKELIVRGGMNIYPREVEEVVLQLPQVSEVAVIGVPDPNMGERVKAVIVLKSGSHLSEADVQAHCKRHLADYKLPRTIAFVEALPKNSTGKVLKRLL